MKESSEAMFIVLILIKLFDFGIPKFFLATLLVAGRHFRGHDFRSVWESGIDKSLAMRLFNEIPPEALTTSNCLRFKLIRQWTGKVAKQPGFSGYSHTAAPLRGCNRP
jgi:hypothetical protein